MKPTLLILAAGMGSRYGGLKQIEPIGPNAETIFDYSIYDAVQAGFKKVVFVIQESFAKEFEEKIGSKFLGSLEVDYVYQDLSDLPKDYDLPDTRKKPWGTGHAILSARNVINEPFAAINADDFYGADAFKKMHNFLSTSTDSSVHALVAYPLVNTLSDHGSVSRGVCQVEDGKLTGVTEYTAIQQDSSDKLQSENPDLPALSGSEFASMNFWGFKPEFFALLEEEFVKFLDLHREEEQSEFFIPSVVDNLIKLNSISLQVLNSSDSWFGITYQQDRDFVQKSIEKLVEQNNYPSNLWN